MTEMERESRMWCDLFTNELTAQSAVHRMTERALLYIESGLPVGKVLDAFKIDESGWTARLGEFEAWRDGNRAAAARMEAQRDERDRQVAARALETAGVLS